jgi:hypothetical protein
VLDYELQKQRPLEVCLPEKRPLSSSFFASAAGAHRLNRRAWRRYLHCDVSSDKERAICAIHAYILLPFVLPPAAPNTYIYVLVNAILTFTSQIKHGDS